MTIYLLSGLHKAHDEQLQLLRLIWVDSLHHDERQIG